MHNMKSLCMIRHQCYSAVDHIHDTACPTHFLNQFQGCQLVAAALTCSLSFLHPRRLSREALSPIPCLNLAAWHSRSTCKMLCLAIHTSLIGRGELNSQLIITGFLHVAALFQNSTECEKCQIRLVNTDTTPFAQGSGANELYTIVNRIQHMIQYFTRSHNVYNIWSD